MKKLICLMISIALMTMILSGCGQAAGETPVADTAAPTEGAPATEAAEIPGETKQTQPLEPEMGVMDDVTPVGNFEIETPYGMLQYPMTWAEYVFIEQENTKDGCIMSFYAMLEGKENQPVFDVIFGGKEGDRVGEIVTDSGAVPVYFRTYSIHDNKELNEDEAIMLLAMVEDINVIYTSLEAMEQFNG